MAEFPVLPCYTDALMGDTLHLNLEERGAYWWLLMIAWRSPDCRLPDDDKRLANMLGITPKRWSRLRPVMLEFFDAREGFWTQKRLTAEREKVNGKRTKNRANGSKGGNARWLKNNGSGMATGTNVWDKRL